MTYRIEMTDQAENDLREIFEYVAFSLLASDNAVRLLNRLEDRISALFKCPNALRLTIRSHGTLEVSG